MQRSARVSGRWPMAAMALGHQVLKRARVGESESESESGECGDGAAGS